MDEWGNQDRPPRRQRLATGSSHHLQHAAAPARPLVTPQQSQQQLPASRQQQQQPWLDTAHPTPAAEGLPVAGPASAAGTTRWLACTFRAGVLGVAAYDRLSNELSVLQTAEEGKGPGAFQMLQYIKLQVDPQVIILSATAEPALIEAAKLPAAAAEGAATTDDGLSAREPIVQLQRPSLFTYSKALSMVNAMQVRCYQQDNRQPQYTQSRRDRAATGPVAELIDTSAQLQVAALGALVAMLLQLQEEEGSSEGTSNLMVDNISELQLEGHLIVDGASLAALDIFKEEEHPSAMGIGSSKEGVSVYGLLQRCVTGMGRRLLRQWFLRPVVQLDVIADRHDTLDLLVAAPTTNDALRVAMKKLQDLPCLLAKLRLSQARPQLATFKQLHDSIRQLMALQAAIAALAPRAAAAVAAGEADIALGNVGGAVGGGSGRAPASWAPAAEFEEEQQGRQPGWLFDDADAAEAATNDFFEQEPPRRKTPGGMFSTPPPSRRRPFTGPHPNSKTRDSSRRGYGAAPPSRGGAWGADAAGGDGLPVGGPWDQLRITEKVLKCIGPELSSCCCMIADVLDLSCSLEGCLVQPGVCAPLDELRETLDQLPAILTQYIEQQLARVPAHVARRNSKQLWSVVYIPQVGFVISISGGKLSDELLELLPDYSLAFMGEDGPAGIPGTTAEDSAGTELDRGCAYYTCDCTQQLNTEFGDLQHKIQDLEASICTELIKRLLQFGPALTAASTAVAELDCLCSLAAAARELGYCRPQLVTDSVIHIEGGRHPLCELLAPGRFIDNDTTLGSLPAAAEAKTPAAAADGTSGEGSANNPRMLLITGPNASGKSVYMKQVALLVYMAHIGSFIPARSAVIGLTDRILTRLPGMESVAQHTSSFMADLAQVSNLLARATSRSLILLDEFGKGTLSADGVGLLASLLQHYAAQPSPPMLLACTHFSELLDPGILPRSPQLGLCTMQVLVGAQASTGAAGAGSSMQRQQVGQELHADVNLEDEHVFLYKLVPGVVAASYGLLCARLCGVDRSVLMRAAAVQGLQAAGQPITRLQVPQLEARDHVCWQLVRQLATVDLSSEEAVKQLMTAVVKSEAGVA